MNKMALIGLGTKIVKKYKKNFSKFTDGDFCVRVGLYDESGSFVKAVECTVNSDNWMDWIEMMDFGDYKVKRVEMIAG